MVRDELDSVEVVASHGAFEVEGIFHVHDCLMLQGVVLDGAIGKKSAAEFRGIKLKVIDAQIGGRARNTLLEGEKGALFVKTEKGKYPLIRASDIIEF